MFKEIFLLIATTVVVARGAYNFNVDVGLSLHGKIIHIQSLRYPGRWLESSSRSVTKLDISNLPERDTYYTQASKFAIKWLGYGGIVVIESMTYPNYYIDSTHTGWAVLTYSSFPDYNKWFQWKIYCTSWDMKNCVFESMRYRGKYFDSHHSGSLGVSSYGHWYSRFRILAPKPTEHYTNVFETINHSAVDQKKSLTLYEGITKTQTNSHTITASTSIEISKAFLTASLQYEWKHVNTQTFQKQTTFKYDITIPKHTKIVLKQLSGLYGPFRTFVKSFKIVSTDLKTGIATTKKA